MTQACPCGSGNRYAVCCGPLHRGTRTARTAEALMRSRYSAFVLRLEPYLLESWHPNTRPETLDLQQDQTRWLGLEIRRVRGGQPCDDHGEVSFTARYRLNGDLHALREDSRFVRLAGRWVYLDGLHPDGARDTAELPPDSPARPPR